MVYNNKKIFLLLLILFLILGLFCFELFFKPIPAASVVSNKPNILRKGIINLKHHELKVEIAESDQERFFGLSGRESLCEHCGMLFNFEEQTPQSFVMRDMKFPLDILFINNGRIINIAANLSPEGHNPKNIYSSEGSVDRVLEVNGGYCAKFDIGPGDIIKLAE